jgi:hypothetical protein
MLQLQLWHGSCETVFTLVAVRRGAGAGQTTNVGRLDA